MGWRNLSNSRYKQDQVQQDGGHISGECWTERTPNPGMITYNSKVPVIKQFKVGHIHKYKSSLARFR